jgi:drug/metabolite transporter (DMT)-like permease
MQISTKANLYLLLATALWGGTFPLIRNALTHIDPSLFVTVRFALAALIMLFLVGNIFKKTSPNIILGCLIIGVINSIAYISQTKGLQTISSSRSAFITGLSVIIVPFIAPLFKLGRTKILDMVCSMISLIGLYILTGADLGKITIGDKWTLLSAITFAVQITGLQYLSLKTKDYRLLTFYQLLFTVPLSLLFSLHTDLSTIFYPNVIIGIFFCTIFATAIAYSIQTKHQKETTAAKAALIFSLEPVFAALFGFLFNHELLTKQEVIGSILILMSLMLPALLKFRRE